jgi:hypothetical protein
MTGETHPACVQEACIEGRLAGGKSDAPTKNGSGARRGAASVPELHARQSALRRRRSFPFGAIWAAPYSASRGTASSEHRAKSCVRASEPLRPCARTITCASPPISQRSRDCPPVLRGEVRAVCGRFGGRGQVFLHASAAPPRIVILERTSLRCRSGIQRKECRRHRVIVSSTTLALDPRPSTRLKSALGRG